MSHSTPVPPHADFISRRCERAAWETWLIVHCWGFDPWQPTGLSKGASFTGNPVHGPNPKER